MRSARLRERLQARGIRRLGAPGRFRYRHADGRRVSGADRDRIDALRIPPAWREVAIATAPRERVQAIGLDAAGRWQYLYARAHTERSAREKFERLVAFGSALPLLRTALRRDLARPGLPLEKAQACSVLLMSACAMRPGAEEYARDNGTFGLATLRARHVEVKGDAVRLCFRGKHGVEQNYALASRLLARLVRHMKRLPGHELLKYQNPDGSVSDLRRHHVNAYVKETMGSRFSARDFRTWVGTLWCAAALRREAGGGEPSKAAVRRAIRATAEHLGNTPAVVRSSYVHPGVIEAFLAGRVVAHAVDHPEALMAHRRGLDRAERALLRLLRGGTPARRAARPARAATAAADGRSERTRARDGNGAARRAAYRAV